MKTTQVSKRHGVSIGESTAALSLPQNPKGLVFMPRVSGSSRYLLSTHLLERKLVAHDLGVCTIDLLTFDDEQLDYIVKHRRGDVSLISGRLLSAVDSVAALCPGIAAKASQRLPFGVVGLGAAACGVLAAATFRPELFAMVAVAGERSALAPYLRWMEAMEGMRGRTLWLGESPSDDAAVDVAVSLSAPRDAVVRHVR